MNLYPKRVEEVHEHLEKYWGHKDRQATEILLASLLKTQRPYPWLIVETDWPSRECQRPDAWFSFGGEAKPHSLPQARVQRSPVCEDIIVAWMSERRDGRPGMFIEPEWRRPQAMPRIMQRINHSYPALEAMCVRLRVDHPRGDFAIRPPEEQKAIATDLARLVRRVLDNDHRKDQKADVTVPKGFLYWCELLQRVAPRQTNWEALIASLTAVAINSGGIYAQEPKWENAERVMRDTVPFVTRWVLEQAGLTKKDGVRAWKLFVSTGLGFANQNQITDEVRRLAKDEVMSVRQTYNNFHPDRNKPWRYYLRNEFKELIDRGQRILV